jgi:antitoxin component YwqK of YwqJK toxin-antitoxin module
MVPVLHITRSGQNMAKRQTTCVDYHKDGETVRAKGGILTGYWEWFRKDGTKLRSGYFKDGKQVGEWTTYDAKGKVYKVTKMKAPI